MATWELTLIRHGKSRWDQAVDDHDRGLKKRGKRDGPRLGRWLAGRAAPFDVIFSSTAKRARQTASLIAAEWEGDQQIRHEPALYTFEAEDLLDFIRRLSPDGHRVALVGHNPAPTDCANRLGGAAIANIPTTGLVQLSAERPWPEWQDGCAQLLQHQWPRELADEA